MDWLANGKRPFIIGHRGLKGDVPENSLAAFALAMEQGADGLELDVQLSADGEVVIIHDRTVDRVSDGEGEVTQLALETLRSLNLGMAQKIPTLDELFEMLGPAPLYNIELKLFGWRSYGLETAVAERVEAHNLGHRVLVSSFNPWAVRQARRTLSRATPTGFLWANWLKRGRFLAGTTEADHPYYKEVDEAYMAWAKKNGRRVHVWTVDEAKEAQRLKNLGVDALITNKPAEIRVAIGR